MFDYVRFCSILFDYVPRIIHEFRVLKAKIRELEGGAYWGGNMVKTYKKNPRPNQTESDENNWTKSNLIEQNWTQSNKIERNRT